MATPETNYDLPVAAGATLAAGSPFLGLIGERKLTGDPHINKNIKRMGLQALEREARPGDVILSSRPGWEGFKVTQAPFSGSEFFHASPVYGRKGGKGTVVDAGDLGEWEGSRATIKDVSRSAKTIHRHYPGHGYSDLVLVRPDKKLTHKQLLNLRSSLTSRAYDHYSVPRGAKAALKDLFVPKLDMFTSKKPPTPCSGTMCSALPAESMAESGILKNIAKGKAPGETLPADFLRAGSGFKPVGAVVRQNRALGPISRQVYRYGTRAGLGAGIGGAIYGGYKDPVTTAGILGGLATPSLARAASTAIYKRLRKVPKDEAVTALSNQLPKLRRLGMELFTPDPEMTPEMLRKLSLRFGTRTVPLALLGGLGTYLAASKIRDSFQNK